MNIKYIIYDQILRLIRDKQLKDIYSKSEQLNVNINEAFIFLHKKGLITIPRLIENKEYSYQTNNDCEHIFKFDGKTIKIKKEEITKEKLNELKIPNSLMVMFTETFELTDLGKKQLYRDLDDYENF
jgi:hypothetical protein